MTVIGQLAERFPQLYLKPEKGVFQSELYRDIVRRGKLYKGDLSHFIGSSQDSLSVEYTPVGEVETVFLANRSDFECLYQIMACRCEPQNVPATMGACYVSGFNDWSKIRAHMESYKAKGGENTDLEFARFTAEPSNYKGTMLLLSKGPYSAVPHEKTPYNEQRWLEISNEIRKYHELTHFVCRKMFPDKKYPVWDELLADCMGLIFAIGKYDLSLAELFLGIENGAYIGGRLENYLRHLPDDKTAACISASMKRLSDCCKQELSKGMEKYQLMLLLEQNAEQFLPKY